MIRQFATILPLAMLAACGPGGGAGVPGDSSDTQPFSRIAEEDVIHFSGNEPFWGGEVRDGSLRWSVPDNIEGEIIAVTRFAGRGGVSFSGELAGQDFTLAVSGVECSDTMADRNYPFTATVKHGETILTGCAWTDAEPYVDTSQP